MAFAEENARWRELRQGLMREIVRAVKIMRVVEPPAAEQKRKARRDGIVHVAGFNGDEAIEKFRRAREAIGPLCPRGCIENLPMMRKRLGQRDGVKDGDAPPGADRHIVDPTAIRPAY